MIKKDGGVDILNDIPIHKLIDTKYLYLIKL